MKPRVKICGITSLKDALLCSSSGADHLGFIFFRGTPRYVEPSKAAAIIRQLPSSVTPVGVFVNETRKAIEKIVDATGVKIIQLSGDEEPADCEGYGVKVWKAFRIRSDDQAERVRDYSIAAALLDGAGDGSYGGSGQAADLGVAVAMKKFHPLILAGGLTPENIVEAIDKVRPFAVDVNSGVELAPGKKDHLKVKRLFERLSSLEQNIST